MSKEGFEVIPMSTFLKELNSKWNSIISLYERKYHSEPSILRNGFAKFWEAKLRFELNGQRLS